MNLIYGLIPNIQYKSSVKFSSDESHPYIFDIASNDSFCVVSGSNHELKSYNYNDNFLTFDRKLSYHNDAVTNLKIHKNSFLISSSKDGRIAIWDLRISNQDPSQVLLGNSFCPIFT